MRTGIRLGIGAGAFFIGIAGAAPARADGVLLSRFDPADRGSRFFQVDSLELGRRDGADPRPLVSAGVASSYAFTTTTWGNHREGKRDTLVKDALWVHPGASITIHPGVRFGLEVPVVAYQLGEDTNLDHDYYLAPSSPRIGDVRASFEMRVLGPTSSESPGFGVTGGVRAWLPTGSADNYAGDDFTRFGVHLSARWRGEWLLAAARAGYMYRPDTYLGGSRVGPEIQASVGAAWVYQAWTVGPELTVASAIDSELAKRSTPVEILFGAHADLGAGLRAGGGVGTALVKGMGAADLRAVLSLEWIGPDARGERDRDHDGLPDRLDMCPDVPGDVDGGRGCPNAPMVPDGRTPELPELPEEPSPTPTIVPPPVVEPPPSSSRPAERPEEI
ncbi:MAG: hypothetical protein U0270_07365 [Labilithrix sp.]